MDGSNVMWSAQFLSLSVRENTIRLNVSELAAILRGSPDNKVEQCVVTGSKGTHRTSVHDQIWKWWEKEGFSVFKRESFLCVWDRIFFGGVEGI